MPGPNDGGYRRPVLGQAVVENGRNTLAISSSALVADGPADLRGIFCASTAAGANLTFFNVSSVPSGNPLITTFAATLGFTRLPFYFGTGLYVSTSASVWLTLGYD